MHLKLITAHSRMRVFPLFSRVETPTLASKTVGKSRRGGHTWIPRVLCVVQQPVSRQKGGGHLYLCAINVAGSLDRARVYRRARRRVAVAAARQDGGEGLPHGREDGEVPAGTADSGSSVVMVVYVGDDPAIHPSVVKVTRRGKNWAMKL